MDIKIYPLGAGREVGRSCLIITINNYRIMLDCGVHMGYNDERKFPEFQRLLKKFKKAINEENLKEEQINKNINNNDNNTYKYVDKKNNNQEYSNIVDLLIISHFHLDHCGALPFFTELLGYKGPILCSQPTKAILPVTLEDFRKDIISTIEDSGIPPSVVRMVLSEVLKLVSDLERRQLAEDFLKGFKGKSSGWSFFIAILAPYWGYWESGFKITSQFGGKTTRFLKFQVLTHVFDDVRMALKPAETHLTVHVPQYSYKNPKYKKKKGITKIGVIR